MIGLKRKAEIEGKADPVPRRLLGNWDENAERSCFQARLGINLEDELLEAVFRATNSEDSQKCSHEDLVQAGVDFSSKLIESWLSATYKRAPQSCLEKLAEFLLGDENITHVASHLGYDDLVFAEECPTSAAVLSNCFRASIGAVSIDNPEKAAYIILDHVVPQLVGKDILHDIWQPYDPMRMLNDILKEHNKDEVEARLVSQTGVNTVLPTFQVALFSGQKYLSQSVAESIVLAEEDAAKIALREIFDIGENKAFKVGINADESFVSQLLLGVDGGSTKLSASQ